MSRIVSLFLLSWPTDRLRQQQGSAAPSAERTQVLAAKDGPRQIITAADAAAYMLGIRSSLPLAQAQARVPEPQFMPADPMEDAFALERLALWALRRHSPVVAVDGVSGLLIDITGTAHLISGEAALAEDLQAHLARSGIPARAVIADTIAAAHAMARFARSDLIAAPDRQIEVIGGLPVAALRLSRNTATRLHAFGFGTVSDLEATPRAPLALRFGSDPGRRLDQAMGRPVRRSTRSAHRSSSRPGIRRANRHSRDHCPRYVGKLVSMLSRDLEARRQSALKLDLLFHRVDGQIQAIRVGLAQPEPTKPDNAAG